MSSPPSVFEGYLAHSPSSAQGQLTLGPFTPHPFSASDIDVSITHSSLDGSDLHVLSSGWYPANYPVVAGHEFVGVVSRLGASVRGLGLGDRVGIGGVVGACLLPDCRACGRGMEQHCPRVVRTYDGVLPGGHRTYGGFARTWRGDARFAVRIPDGVKSNEAAPLLCAGITVYAPMRQCGVREGSRVGVVGIGGLGHLGLLFAKALGAARVVAISRTGEKRGDAARLGADEFIATAEEGWEGRHAGSLDLIISTVSDGKMPLGGYLGLLDIGGVYVQVGSPEDVLPQWRANQLIINRISIRGGYLGSLAEIREMLELVAEKQIHPWVEDRPMTEINQALIDFNAGKPRYRIVLYN